MLKIIIIISKLDKFLYLDYFGFETNIINIIITIFSIGKILIFVFFLLLILDILGNDIIDIKKIRM
jgi:hypothetical protein